MPHKIGIYVRVSTEEQAQVQDGSIDSQQHRLKSYVDIKCLQEKTWGKIIETYIDDGYSAKDTRRPAYQRMMNDIRKAKINLILVTDISRLSRNIHDFCLLLKELDEQKAKFFSLKEQFDTSTPAGEMMIYNMINLAQFERKQTSERVSINFHSRALRGLKNGGNPVLGYDKDPANKGKLVVNQDEVPLVKRIFEIYLETGSLQETARQLNGSGIRPKISEKRKCRHVADGRWSVGVVRNHLTNLTYIGKREVNQKHKDEDQDELKPWHRHQVVTASWPGIIDESTFYNVQTLVQENRDAERTRFKNATRRFFLLSGIIRCGECGRALIGQAAHGRSDVHRYYAHKVIVGETNTCKNKRFRADGIEDAVVQHLDDILLRSGHLDTVEKNIAAFIGVKQADLLGERDCVQKQIVSIDKDIEAAFRLHLEVKDSPEIMKLVREKLDTLAERRKKLIAHKEEMVAKIELTGDAKAARMVVEDRALAFKKGWPKASRATQKRLIRRLVQNLIYSASGLQVFYVTTNESATAMPSPKMKMASDSKSEANSSNSYIQPSALRRPSGFLLSTGSPVVQSGGDGGN